MSKRRLKRKIIFTMILAMLSIFQMTSVTAEASDWKTAYANIIKGYDGVENHFSSGCFNYVKNYFRLSSISFSQYFVYDVNKDKVPELFLPISGTHGLTAVLTYKGGVVRGLGYLDLYGINKKKNVLVVHGHWHGAGGSGGNEWHTYKIGSNDLKMTNYIDNREGRYTVYEGGKYNVASQSVYKKLYSAYIKGTTSISKFKKYSRSTLSGLKK